MSFSIDQLNQGEKLVTHLKPHWWYFIRQIVLLAVLFIVGILALAFELPGWFAAAVGVGLLLALVWFLIAYWKWSKTSFVITTDRLIDRTGILSRQGTEIPLESVNTVFFKQTLFERMLRSGDLVIESAGEQGSQSFTNIRNPLNVQNEIHKQMEANENRKFDRAGSAVVASIPEQIEKLGELRDKGLISTSEFAQKKDELLKRL